MITGKIISNVLCTVQGCLVGHVTPNLRAVYVLIKKEDEYELVFYYNNSLSEVEEELASLVDTYFISDCPSDCKTQCTVHVLPYPEKLRQDHYCVYRRYEGEPL